MTVPTILCVDDEVNVLRAIRRLLRKEDYQVLTAASGEEGLELLQTCAPEVIISDQRMPGMSGTEFLERAKQLHPDSIRVVLSGYADAATILESINHGHIFRFLTKPWDDEVLRDGVRDCLRQFDIARQNSRLTEQIAVKNAQLERLNLRLAEVVEERTRSLQLAQEVLSRIPMPVIGVGSDGVVALRNDAVTDAPAPWNHIFPGEDLVQSLPAELATAARSCILGEIEFQSLESPADGADAHVFLQRLSSDGQTRGCLIILGGSR